MGDEDIPRDERIRNAQGRLIVWAEPISNLHLVHRIDNTTSPDFWCTLSFPDLSPLRLLI